MSPNLKFITLLLIACKVVSAEQTPDATPEFSIVARKEVKLDDHKITYVRVKPPKNLPKLPPTPVAAEPTSEQMARWKELETKTHVQLNNSCVVYLTKPKITQIKLRVDDKEFTCYSNVDFRNLSAVNSLEDANTVYSWFPWISESEPDGSIPAGLELSTTEAEYIVEASEADVAKYEEQFKGLDLLHAYFTVHKDTLIADRIKRETEAEAREKELRENPPKKQDTVIYFWKKEESK
jgi:hypothetical protein